MNAKVRMMVLAAKWSCSAVALLWSGFGPHVEEVDGHEHGIAA